MCSRYVASLTLSACRDYHSFCGKFP